MVPCSETSQHGIIIIFTHPDGSRALSFKLQGQLQNLILFMNRQRSSKPQIKSRYTVTASYSTALRCFTSMSALERSASSRATRLAARASPYHSSVTLFDVDESRKPSSRPSKRVKLEDAVVDIEDTIPDTTTADELEDPGPSSRSAKRIKSSSPRKPKPIQKALKVPHLPPQNWRETYDSIKEMRTRIAAPVDSMGCDQAQLKETEPKVRDTFPYLRFF
jgi:hypothetical protein